MCVRDWRGWGGCKLHDVGCCESPCDSIQAMTLSDQLTNSVGTNEALSKQLKEAHAIGKQWEDMVRED